MLPVFSKQSHDTPISGYPLVAKPDYLQIYQGQQRFAILAILADRRSTICQIRI
jgi:hypothetical protein